MTYRPVRIMIQKRGILGYTARVILEDDGLPKSECPIHGWDGPARNAIGSRVEYEGPGIENLDCVCPQVSGFDVEQGPYDAFSHKRAYRKALRAVGGKLYEPMRPKDY